MWEKQVGGCLEGYEGAWFGFRGKKGPWLES